MSLSSYTERKGFHSIHIESYCYNSDQSMSPSKDEFHLHFGVPRNELSESNPELAKDG
jgi:hypothetical protein